MHLEPLLPALTPRRCAQALLCTIAELCNSLAWAVKQCCVHSLMENELFVLEEPWNAHATKARHPSWGRYIWSRDICVEPQELQPSKEKYSRLLDWIPSEASTLHGPLKTTSGLIVSGILTSICSLFFFSRRLLSLQLEMSPIHLKMLLSAPHLIWYLKISIYP